MPSTPPLNVVVYYRTRPTEPEESDAALAEQRADVATWVAERNATVLAEHIEQIDDIWSRPALKAAIDDAKARSAILLIASIDPIGSGRAFSPSIMSVPIRYAYNSDRPPRQVIPFPYDAPERVCLYFGRAHRGGLAVYLCNPGPEPLTEVSVASTGFTSKFTSEDTVGAGEDAETVSAPLTTPTARASYATVPPRSGLYVDDYNPMWDGDMLVGFEIKFVQDGVRQIARAIIDRIEPHRSWVPLKLYKA